MSFKKVLRALKALPKEERVLARGVYVFSKGGCGCALGKVMPSISRYAPKTKRNSFGIHELLESARMFISRSGHGWNYHNVREETRRLYKGVIRDTKNLEVTDDELIALQGANDSYHCYEFELNSLEDRKARYKHIVNWLTGQVAKAKKELQLAS